MRFDITLDISKPREKYLHLKYDISAVSGADIVLTFPAWTPGSYMIREYGSQVDAFCATDERGRALIHKKINKCQWHITTGGAKKIIVSYRVYAGEFNVRAAYADHAMVFINGAAAFFHVENARDAAIILKIKAPPKWHLAYAAKPKGSSYYFDGFDALYDAPLLAARDLNLKRFSVKNTSYKMAFCGHHAGNLGDIARDVKKIIKKQIELFRDQPCRDYLFQVMFVSKMYGGLEHAYSSTNIFDGELLANKMDYKRFLALLSHEHFHLWNVKRIRPSELGSFDYKTEVYTRELWMAEGITSFYDDHFVYRAGLYSKQEYLDLIAENITKLEAGKAARVNSISDASFDAWIRFYRPTENSLNTVVSYYLKGGLVMMLLDIFIIKETSGHKNLDDVMRALYKIYLARPQTGITRAEFLFTIKKITGKPADLFFKKYIDGTQIINWTHELARLGIRVKTNTEKDKRYLGVILTETLTKVSIQNIAEDSPAYHSDLQAGDEIIAINNQRISSTKQLDAFLQKPAIEILFSRFGQTHTTVVNLNAKPKAKFILSPAKRLTRSGKVFLRTS